MSCIQGKALSTPCAGHMVHDVSDEYRHGCLVVLEFGWGCFVCDIWPGEWWFLSLSGVVLFVLSCLPGDLLVTGIKQVYWGGLVSCSLMF